MRSMRWWLLAGCLACVPAAGCDVVQKLTEQMQKAADEASNKAEAEEEPNPDEALGLKLNHHIECINNTSGMVLRARSRYVSWFDDEEKGPTGNERAVYGLYNVTDSIVKRCKDELTKAQGVEPETKELDELAEKYEAKLDKVVPLVEAAYKYYNQQDYKDDKFKKAKEMHAPLMKAFEEFDKADEKFREKIAELKDGMAERELAHIEETDGKNLLWHSRKLNMVARQVVETADVPDLEDLDLKTLEGVIADFEAALTKMEKHAKDNKAEVDAVMMFSMYQSEAQELLKAAKSLMRRKRDKVEYQQSEIMMMNGGNPQMVDGHPAQVVDKFNGLIKQSNNLNW